MFLGFEDIKFYNYVEEKGKGGKNKHVNTTIIKNDVIRNMFSQKKNENPKSMISNISNSIIRELN